MYVMFCAYGWSPYVHMIFYLVCILCLKFYDELWVNINKIYVSLVTDLQPYVNRNPSASSDFILESLYIVIRVLGLYGQT